MTGGIYWGRKGCGHQRRLDLLTEIDISVKQKMIKKATWGGIQQLPVNPHTNWLVNSQCKEEEMNYLH